MTKPGTGDELDCVIAGGGPAGLTAALYLARFNRKFVVIDSGQSRAAWIPESHNIPVFANGIAGPDILKRQRSHAEMYGARIISGKVTKLTRRSTGFTVGFEEGDAERKLETRFVLLATGVADIAPPLPNIERAVEHGLLRFCPICDGYEAKDKKIAVIGKGSTGLGEAAFIARTYTPYVTFFSIGAPFTPTREDLEKLEKFKISYAKAPTKSIACVNGKIQLTVSDGSRAQEFDTVYAALGVQYRSSLATDLGARPDNKGALAIDQHSETNVPGLYAAGDVTEGLNQIVVGMSQAAIAATAIHNRC